MKIIYVVEPEDLLPPEVAVESKAPIVAGPVPLSRGASPFSPTGVALNIGTGVLARQIIGNVPIGSLPIQLVMAAVAARPYISRMFQGEKKEHSEGATDPQAAATAKAIADAQAREIQEFMRKNCVTMEDAKRDFRFPPAHPQVGVAYVLHPLAELPKSGKDGMYIPRDRFDEVLLEEREAELIRLLVTLGAKKISILDALSTNQRNGVSGGASAGIQKKRSRG